MSAALGSSELLSTPQSGKRNGVRPLSGEKMKNKQAAKSPKSNSSKGLMKIFKKGKAKENGVVPVRPSCFDDDFVKRSESPDSPSRGPAVASGGGKPGRAKEERSYGLWRPKGKCEWESDSGRMLTLKPVEMNKLSQVELLAFQRVAINQLQSMNLPVSHAIIAASKKGRLSFNSFSKRRISTGNDQAVGMFGLPIDKVATDRTGSSSGAATPVSSSSRSGSLQPPSSPTSTDIIFLDNEPNPTAVLLEALSKTDRATAPPSPKTQRQIALRPSEPRVPPIVRKAIELLDEKAVMTEGLFRISGSKARIYEIKQKFDRGEDVDLTDANPHDIAALLKEFFRSLPEPLMTRELFGPILGTRKLSSSAQRRDALRLFCLLLPQANRDTLQALLQFLSRVALHSDGIILIDGTQETGNRMTEQNLGLIMGPNILHKEQRKPAGVKPDYQVVKQDQEELEAVCKVMEDLIRMHASILTIPAELYDQAIKALQPMDPEGVDTLLKRKCMDQGSDGVRRVTPGNTPTSTLRLVVPPGSSPSWRRSRSLSDTEKTLDDAIRELDSLQVNINDDLEVARRHRHYSSNDSAMGESEVVMSPAPSAGSEPSTLSRPRDIARNRSDSAFSNNTSPTNSSNEGMNTSDALSLESDPSVVHQRNASTLSSTSEPDRQLGEGGHTSLSSARPHPTSDSVSLPTFSPERELGHDLSSLQPCERSVSDIPAFRSSSSALHKQHKPSPTARASAKPGNQDKSKHKKRKLKTMPSVASSGTYSPTRSPVLTSRSGLGHSSEALSETSTEESSANHTPTPPTTTFCHSSDHLPTASTGSGSTGLSDDGTVI